MKYLLVFMMTICSLIVSSCDGTSDSLIDTAGELGVQSISSEVAVQLIGSIRDNFELAAIDYNPFFSDITVEALALSEFVSFSGSETVESGEYFLKISNLANTFYSAENLNVFDFEIVADFHDGVSAISLFVTHPQTSPDFFKLGASTTDPLVIELSTSPNQRLIMTGATSARQTIEVLNQEYSLAVSATATDLILTNYHATDGDDIVLNPNLCISDIVSGTVALTAAGSVELGTDDINVSYSATGAIDFTSKYGYMTVPKIDSEGVVVPSGETVHCFYFGSEITSATILNEVPTTLLPTGQECLVVSNLIEVQNQDDFFSCVE